MAADGIREPELRPGIPVIEEYRALRVAARLSAEGAATGLAGAWLVAPAAHGMLLRL